MTIHKKAAGRGNSQAAFKPSSTSDHSNCKRPVSTFIQVDAHHTIGADGKDVWCAKPRGTSG